MVGIGVVSGCITETKPIPTIYDEENVVKERCITETTPIPTIYDEENLNKERCITETTPIPVVSLMQHSLIRFSSS
jgi:hypothetical protein